MTEFLMPSLGADMEAGTLVEWKKKPGDQLKPGDIIAEVETQKGLIEIEVFEAGVLEEYLIEEGDKVPVGAPMAKLRSEGTPEKIPEKDSETHPIQEKEQVAESEAPVPTASISKERPSEDISSEEKDSEEKPRIKASPLARSIAEKNNVDITGITGTGEGGAITKADVEQAMAGKKELPKPSPETATEKDTMEKEAESETPSKQVMESPAPSSKHGQQESIRASVAAAMSRSNRDIPHYYLEKKDRHAGGDELVKRDQPATGDLGQVVARGFIH